MQTEGGGYKIAKSIRDICLFSRHDVTSDPPFPRMDIVACRNLLIYFTATLQKHVIPIFHYALGPKGFLWLGRSESVGGFSNLFLQIDKVNKIYSRRNTSVALSLNFPSRTYVPGPTGVAPLPASLVKVPVDVQKLAERTIQEDYPGLLINDEMEILQYRGPVGSFINPTSGAPSNHLFKMVRPEILPFLRIALQTARKQKSSVKKEGLSFREGLSLKTFNLKILPVKSSAPSKINYYLIHFEDIVDSEIRKKSLKKGRSKKLAPDKISESHLAELQQELASNQEYQQTLIERSEATQESLTAANEELQSTNEELETAKEELQSGNEELTTVNDELQSRSIDQIQTNNDLVNLLGSVQIPIVMLGNDRKVRRFTPLAGKALNLIATDVGRPISDLKFNFSASESDLDLEQVTSEVIDTMESREIEVQDRQGRWFRLQIRPYKTIDGRIDGAVLALVDIDGLKQSLNEVKIARADAEKANRAKDLFLATLSHELRTPLTAILSWAQMLQSGKLDADKIKRAGQTIEDCGKTQVALINDLLDVSRIIVGKLSLEMRETNPEDILSRAIESVRSDADRKSIQIQTHFDGWAGTVMADHLRLWQVFSNLLTNAIKFSSPNSRVLVKLEKVKDREGEKVKAFIQVIDSGKGISPGFLPHIFDSFSQEDSSSIRVHGGLGLGLAIVKNLVELHGGEVKAESPGEKLGATFTVILPLKSEHQASNNPKASVGTLENSQSFPETDILLDGIRVLIVDDQETAREALIETLRSYGAEVQGAQSGKEAFKKFQLFRPHVLVSDITMPGEDGYSLIQKIRALSASMGGKTPALALTACTSKEDIDRTISAGFQAHLPKPADGRLLGKIVVSLASA
jgi:two-component system CheB/CheR fusion protein